MPSARSARVRAIRIAALGLLAPWPLQCSIAAAPAVPAAASGHPYAQHVADAAGRFAIPELWIWRVMYAESRGNPHARSRAGAMGLMQIMPATWAMLTARHRLGSDPYSVRANIMAGAAYLRAMWDRYGDTRLMLAAYNAGPGRVDAYAAGRRGLPAETIAYVTGIAPEIGAPSTNGPSSASQPATVDWRSGSVFVAQAGGRSTAQSDALLGRAASPDMSAAVDGSATQHARQTLFIPLSGREQ
jgi:soluble lytic murein transglycosylase-like protein